MLDQRITLYVPSTNAMQQPDAAAQARWRVAALRFLATRFGGATSDSPSLGAWMSADGTLVTECVVKVGSFTDRQTLRREWAAVLRFARDMGTAMGQETVAVELNNKLRFINPTRVTVPCVASSD